MKLKFSKCCGTCYWGGTSYGEKNGICTMKRIDVWECEVCDDYDQDPKYKEIDNEQ